MTVLLAYIFYFVAATAFPLQRRWLATKRDGGGQIEFAFHTMFIVAFLGTLVLPFIHPFNVQGNPALLVCLALACGLSGAGYFVSSYSAQKHVDAGLTTLINNIYTPITIILATLFLHEGLKPLQFVGTLLLLTSIILVSKKHRLGRFKFDLYFWLMIFSGVILGITLSAERGLMKTTGFTAGVLMSWWAQAICLGLATLFFKNRTTYTTRDSLITGGLKFLQGLSWVLLVFIVGNLSVASSITTFKVVVVFAAAAILLGEREDLVRKIIGSFIAVVGLIAMK